jgi:hypothetical protein
VGVEWHYTFGLLNPPRRNPSAALENHQVELSQPGIAHAQGLSFYFCCVDRGAEPGAGDEGDASVHPGLDGTSHWMVHCFSCCIFSFSTEAFIHQPFSSVRFYLINLLQGHAHAEGLFGPEAKEVRVASMNDAAQTIGSKKMVLAICVSRDLAIS